ADTVYGLACEPDSKEAVQRLYMLKRRRPDKPAAVMFFALDLALAALPELGSRTVGALHALLPGPVTVLLPNPAERFPLACADDPLTLGVRVPAWPPALAALGDVRWPVLQSSANTAGGPDARRLDEVPEHMRSHADLVLDGGELPGTPSTVVDLRSFETDGEWSVAREGAMSVTEISARLDG
ncbi:MAG: L-threonylcarbamoyladenylate synthase, partial [Solirubrobacteraceae bacterium]